MNPICTQVMDELRAHMARLSGQTVVVGALPPDGGLALVPGGGTANRFMDGDSLLKMSVAVNSKSREQADALSLLEQACADLPTEFCPYADAWLVSGASIRRPPTLLGQDSAGWWMYGCNVEIRVYIGTSAL